MRNIRFLVLVLVVMVGVSSSSRALADHNFPDRKALIINICPSVELSDFSYGNFYEDGGTWLFQNMKWKNIGGQDLVAFEIVILKYDAFNRRLIGTQWTVTGKNSRDWSPLAPGQSDGEGTRSLGEEAVYTGIAYVRLARLHDGTIWRVDDTRLLAELRKAAPDIPDFGDVKPDPKPSSK